MSGTVDELLHLAELARERKAYVEARVHLTRPEPYYQLAELSESGGNLREALHYYYMALEARPTFAPAREALKRLGHLDPRPAA